MTEQLDLVTGTTATCPFDHHSADLTGLAKYEVFAGLRDRRVQRTDAYGGYWVLTHAADVEAALLDHGTYSSQRQGVYLPPHDSPVPLAGIEHDPPEHVPFRRLYAKAVGRPAVTAAEPRIRELARKVIGRFADAGGGEFVTEVASVLPVETIAMVVGLDDDAARRVRELTEHAWAHFTEPDAMVPLIEMVMSEVGRRRAEPRDDFLTEISSAEMLGTDGKGGRPITDTDIVGVLNGLIIAGHETTMSASSALALQLARDPDLRARLVADPSLIPAVVEESLRFDSPVQAFVRTLTRDVEIDGVTMPEGDRVMVLYGAANHDPLSFPDPDVFDPARTNLKHYSFGWGLHRCVGAQLAQVELRIICGLLAEREFTVVGEPVYGPPSAGGAFNALTSLRLAFS